MQEKKRELGKYKLTRGLVDFEERVQSKNGHFLHFNSLTEDNLTKDDITFLQSYKDELLLMLLERQELIQTMSMGIMKLHSEFKTIEQELDQMQEARLSLKNNDIKYHFKNNANKY